MIKGSMPQEKVTIISTYSPNFGATKYIKQYIHRSKEIIIIMSLLLIPYFQQWIEHSNRKLIRK